MCTSLCLLSAVLLGVLYLFFGVCPSNPSTRVSTKALTPSQAFPLVFGNNHGFNLWQTGLTFLGLFVGDETVRAIRREKAKRKLLDWGLED
jgi:hypothetical protein